MVESEDFPVGKEPSVTALQHRTISFTQLLADCQDLRVSVVVEVAAHELWER